MCGTRLPPSRNDDEACKWASRNGYGYGYGQGAVQLTGLKAVMAHTTAGPTRKEVSQFPIGYSNFHLLLFIILCLALPCTVLKLNKGKWSEMEAVWRAVLITVVVRIKAVCLCSSSSSYGFTATPTGLGCSKKRRMSK